MPLQKLSDLEKTVAAASGVFRDVCSEEPSYHTAEELCEGLKQGEEGGRLLFVLFLRLRKNERTPCTSASGVFCDVCSEEPPYHTAEELWEALKQGDEGARLLFVFFLRLRKNEQMRCSVEKAIAAEGKRWVAVLIEEAWRLYLLMCHRAVPYQGKPKSVIAIEGSTAQRRILARSGLARYSAPSVK